MPELKTQRNEGDVDAFINSVEDDVRRRDAAEVKEIMTRLSGPAADHVGRLDRRVRLLLLSVGRAKPRVVQGGFSPRKQYLTLHLGHARRNRDLLDLLGPHGKGKACLYVKDLRKVDRGVVEELVIRSLHQFDASA
jgi:hypothetical protein